MASARVAAGAFGGVGALAAALAFSARLPVLAALAALAALAHGAPAAAQETPRIVGLWTPAASAAPDPLPLKDASRGTLARGESSREIPPGSAESARGALTAPSPCAAPGMPALLDTPAEVEITQQGDRVRMRYTEWGDTTRTVYMNPRNGPATQEPSPLGVSFGRWEGHTLAIFTTYIAYPYFDRAGTAQSAAVTVLERYTPSADRSRLEWRATVTDAATFTKPVVMNGSMAASSAAAAPAPAAALAAALAASASASGDAASSGPTPAAPLVPSGCVG